MIKLKRFGIKGRMLDWIEAFMKDRTLHDAISEIFDLENSTVQGTMLSPLAFLDMIDDLPSLMDDMGTSLCADDSMPYRAGENIKRLVRSVQRALDKAVVWAEEWGFKIFTEKSVAMLFSQINGSKREDVKLTIGKEPAKVEKNCKVSRRDFR
jgi:Reverse transcriptase (RNA-dependent DNA polymerase)